MKSLKTLFIWTLIAKLLLSAWLPLTADEAYYWVWSHSLDWSYFDHPAMVAVLYRFGHIFENLGSAVRWPGVLLGHATLGLWILLLKRHLSRNQIYWFALIALTAPMTGPGSLIITPDTPMLFFWSLLFLKVDRLRPEKLFADSLIVGALLGLGFDSKYTIVLFAPLALYLLFKTARNIPEALQGLFTALGAFALFSFPVWWWNLHHDWLSLGFQMNHGLESKKWNPKWPLEYVLGQIALIFPTILYFASKARNVPLQLKYAAWFPIAFFFLTSFRAYPEANWPLMSYLPLIGLAVIGSKNLNWAKTTIGIWISCLILTLGFVAFQNSGWVQTHTKLKEMNRYNDVTRFAQTHEPLYARTYQMASKLSFELKKPIFKLAGMNRFDFYDLQEQSLPKDRYFWLITEEYDELPEFVREHYRRTKIHRINNTYEAWRLDKK
ncbi:MAG: glycosyltransferase family 39 protein [Bdellovibrionales bacterium]|nr:glycosyltransferase family 39 protein [Bdellovibrionales bacterium]